MDAVRDMTGHWPDSAVHFEDFVGASAPHADDQPFEVKLAKSGEIYEVAAHVSILDTLRKHGHVLASSCESGTCGTCSFCTWTIYNRARTHLSLNKDVPVPWGGSGHWTYPREPNPRRITSSVVGFDLRWGQRF